MLTAAVPATPTLARSAAGVRGFEIDVHADPEGGRYAQVAGLRLAGLNGTLPYRDLYEPGFKASVGAALCG